MNYKAPRGTHDIFGVDLERMSLLEQNARTIFKKYGFKEMRTPIFEDASLFTRSVGKVTDIVKKEMYIFKDRKERKLALRPEGTASIVRAFIEHRLDVMGPAVVKFFYMGEMFRYERPQAGRYRQFHQIGAEFFGSSSPAADAEIILLAYDLLRSVGINKVSVRLNSLGCQNCRHAFREELVKYLISIEGLCGDCRERLWRNPLRVLDCKIDLNRFTCIPEMSNYLCSECKNDFSLLKSLLDGVRCNYKVDNRLVRGLDYYTKTVFEIYCTDIDSHTEIAISEKVEKELSTKVLDIGQTVVLAAGGRYDNLVEELGGRSTPAVGFALGSERVLIVADSNLMPLNIFQEEEIYYIAIVDQELFKEAFSFAVKIRRDGLKNNKNISVFGPIDGKSLTWQLKFADKIGASKTVIFAKIEFEKGKVLVKNMQNAKDKIQTEVLIDEFLNVTNNCRAST